MLLIDYLTELVYAAVGALLGFLLMKMDDMLNNKQYTNKEYSKTTLLCFLATLSGLLLMRFVGPMRLPNNNKQSPDNIIRPMATGLIGGSNHSGLTLNMNKPPSIPSSGTSLFQPANNSNALRFTAGTPTF